MITNAAKYDVAEKYFVQEIQQLGLPKENADVISLLYTNCKDKLRERFAETSYRVSKIVNTDWRVDKILASSNSHSDDVSPYSIKFDIRYDTNPTYEPVKSIADENIVFEMSSEKLDLMIYELSKAKVLMDNIDTS